MKECFRGSHCGKGEEHTATTLLELGMDPKLLHKRKHPPALKSTAQEAPVDRLWIVGLAVGAILGGIVLWLFDKNPQYAVCSHSNHIYTVDETNPTVQCISVKGGRILDTGSLGTWTRIALKCV